MDKIQSFSSENRHRVRVSNHCGGLVALLFFGKVSSQLRFPTLPTLQKIVVKRAACVELRPIVAPDVVKHPRAHGVGPGFFHQHLLDVGVPQGFLCGKEAGADSHSGGSQCECGLHSTGFGNATCCRYRYRSDGIDHGRKQSEQGSIRAMSSGFGALCDDHIGSHSFSPERVCHGLYLANQQCSC